MRLGKFVEHFKAAALAADSKSMDPVLKYLAVGRQLGYAFYMTFDAMTYIDQVGIRKFEGAARLQREAYRAWLAGLLCNVVAGIYQLYNMQAETKSQEVSADAEKAVELKKIARYVLTSVSTIRCEQVLTRYDYRERSAVQLQLISDLCDATVPSSALGYANFDDGFVGLAGTTSSLIGLTAQWAKTA